MRYKYMAATLSNSSHKVTDNAVTVIVINAESVFHGDWNGDRVVHRADAVSYEQRLPHQTRTKCAILNPI